MAEKKDKDDKKRPIIVKKIKKGGGGHHGGAWKVAYADFVTAMMAFFLLLWLLSTSSKATLEGLAEYFTPTTGIKDSQGIGFKGGTSSAPVGAAKTEMATPSVVPSQVSPGHAEQNEQRKSPEDADEEDSLFKQGAKEITQAFNESKTLQQYSDNITVQSTPEGLKIEIADSDKYPMFERGKAVLTEHGKAVFGKMAELLKKMPNYMNITGHTDAGSPDEASGEYSNWELSTDRAQAARRFLTKSGLEPERPRRVTGMADTDLLMPEQPRSPRNRRITLLMLRDSHILIPNATLPSTVAVR